MGPRTIVLVWTLLATIVVVGTTSAATIPNATTPSLGDPSNPQAAATLGEWSPAFSWPVIGVHSIVLRTGEVLTYSYPQGGAGSAGLLWNPTAGTMVGVPVSVNVFCSGQSVLADGRVLVTGGNIGSGQNPAGPAYAYSFDPVSEQWAQIGTMSVGRYYPTNVTLADGSALIFAGLDEQGHSTPLVERFDPAAGFQVLPIAPGAERYISLYPRMHLLPSGQIFHAGPERDSYTFDPASISWSEVASMTYGYRGGGSSVLLPLRPPDYRPEVLAIGGGNNPATNTVERIDLGAAVPSWSDTSAMSFARRNLNPVLLPDGTVLVVGGTATGQDEAPVYEAEIYDPDAGTWTTVASMQRPRVYHSTAVLLRDGRVLAAGSDGEPTAEIYSPPYLFQGPRPSISSLPANVDYGASFEVSTPQAQDIASVVLMRPGAMTHSVDMEQRYVGLEFLVEGGSLTVDAPASGNVAPVGDYMLFIVDSNGVPSEATFLQLGGAAVGGVAGSPQVDAASLSEGASAPMDARLLALLIAAVSTLCVTIAVWYAKRIRPRV